MRKVEVDHARLHHREPVALVDLQDPVHLGQHHRDRAVDRVGRTGQPGPGAARHDRHAGRRAGPDDGGHLGGVGREDHGQRRSGRRQRHHVPAVGGGDIRVEHNIRRADGFGQFLDQLIAKLRISGRLHRPGRHGTCHVPTVAARQSHRARTGCAGVRTLSSALITPESQPSASTLGNCDH